MKKSILILISVFFCEFGFSQNLNSNDTLKKPASEDSVVVVDVAPEYPDGLNAMYGFIIKNINYPEDAKTNGIEGKVYVNFYIEKDGTVTNVVVEKGIGGGCDEEAVRVVSMMPKWNPGQANGNPVRVRYRLPVPFRL
ncbi:MAG: energy transducer TonB [Bacteroidota bacterium]